MDDPNVNSTQSGSLETGYEENSKASDGHNNPPLLYDPESDDIELKRYKDVTLPLRLQIAVCNLDAQNNYY